MAVPAAQAAPNPTVNPGDLVISEFRFHGPSGASDEFFEIYNRTGNSIDLNSDEDASVFWIEYWDPTPPAGSMQIVPAFDSDVGPRRKYLMTNKPGSGGYSLDGYAFGDTEYDVTGVGGDVPFNGGVALYYDPDVNDGINQRTRIDAAGFTGGSGGGVNYWEGIAEPPLSSALTTENYSHYRKFTSVGLPTDTNSNSPDFHLAVTDDTATYGGQPAIMGAPGPENRAAPPLENDGATPSVANDGMLSQLMNPGVSSSSFPNREYVAPSGCSGSPAVCTTPGTLTIRRRIVNRTGSGVTELRFRITQLTTYGTATSSQALLRAIDTNTATVAGEPALGTKVEEPPNQLPEGGGINSSMFVNLAEDPGLPGGVLPNGGDVVVTFRFAVDRGGSYQFSYNHEAA
ncbi:MAG TPA: hypothetical protein VHF89_17395 [Solirubrobacteraceae bacterium]|nr:hypothetical protein [Solirubrobacteraceae bacterium]